MQADDDEARAVQIHSYLLRHDHRLLSLSTILRGRCELGWTYRGSVYYQLIHQVNKEKQLEWARAHLQEYFEDVVWLDETTVQLHFSLLPTCNWARLYNSHLVDGNNVR